MQNSITNSSIDVATMAHFGNGNVILDINSIALFLVFLALVFVGIAVFSYVNYVRDRDNVPSLRKIEKKIDFYSLDLIRINNRLNELEDKGNGIEALQKSISELKSILRRRTQC